MTQSSFFNVGGRLVENHLDGHDELPDGKMPRVSTKRTPILFDEAVGQGAAALNYVVTRESDGYSAQRATRGVGRARRAKWALTTAATLAMADGPLPIGDAAAVVFLTGYGIYEGYGAVQDFIQYS